MTMKIAFTGSHCTGKTTLLNLLKSVYTEANGFRYVDEVARNLINNGYPLNKDATEDSYIHYIIKQLNAEKAMYGSTLFISDRTLLDPLAYSLVNREFHSSNVQDVFIEMLESIWSMEKERYDLYVYFPIAFPMASDGVRPSDDEYRELVDKTILMLLKKYAINYKTISGSLQERFGILTSWINAEL